MIHRLVGQRLVHFHCQVYWLHLLDVRTAAVETETFGARGALVDTSGNLEYILVELVQEVSLEDLVDSEVDIDEELCVRWLVL